MVWTLRKTSAKATGDQGETLAKIADFRGEVNDKYSLFASGVTLVRHDILDAAAIVGALGLHLGTGGDGGCRTGREARPGHRHFELWELGRAPRWNAFRANANGRR